MLAPSFCGTGLFYMLAGAIYTGAAYSAVPAELINGRIPDCACKKRGPRLQETAAVLADRTPSGRKRIGRDSAGFRIGEKR